MNRNSWKGTYNQTLLWTRIYKLMEKNINFAQSLPKWHAEHIQIGNNKQTASKLNNEVAKQIRNLISRIRNVSAAVT